MEMQREGLTSPHSTYFEFQAAAGLTKHLGAVSATDDLIALCHINEDSYVLDVGCGVGLSTSYIANKRGCHIVGVDLRQSMVERAQKRATQEDVTHLTEFRVADAQCLPFPDNTFEAVFSESVVVFTPDKARTLREYVRVTKPGGYVGLNEAIWLEKPVPEMTEILNKYAGGGDIITHEEWAALLIETGLENIVALPHEVSIKRDAVGQIKRIGIGGVLSAWGRSLRLLFGNSEYRDLMKDAVKLPKEVMKNMGYGIYVGHKPA